MRNMSYILTSQNEKILPENEKQYECKFRNKDECLVSFREQMFNPTSYL